MKILARSLVVLLPALLAGVVAWMFIPFQPERSVLVPAGTKLLEFSPAGQYVVTFQRGERRLTLRQTDTGEAKYEAEIPLVVPSNVSTNGARAFYGFSADDRWLAIATGRPSHLVIVDLSSGNMGTRVDRFPPDSFAESLSGPDKVIRALGENKCGPRPAFSSDGRYLSYFNVDNQGDGYAILYDLAERREQLRVPNFFDSLGPPTRQGKWLLVNRANGIEVWDVAQRRRQVGAGVGGGGHWTTPVNPGQTLPTSDKSGEPSPTCYNESRGCLSSASKGHRYHSSNRHCL